MSRKITVEIFDDGSTKVEAHNYVGTACSLPVRELVMAMAGGSEGVDTRPKPDFYATNPGQNFNNIPGL